MKKEKYEKKLLKELGNNFKLQLMTCVVLSLLVITAFYLLYRIIPVKYDYSITNDISLINQIENVNVEKNKINIDGYAFLLNIDSIDTKISLLLRNVDDGKEIWADVEQTSRTDVNSYFDSEYNYKNSGFNAVVNDKKLNTNECYEIIVKLDYSKILNEPSGNTELKDSKTVSTNKYILNYKLYSYNPNDFDQLDTNVKSDLLREVFTNGRLCTYQKHVDMYVYQYDSSLYWIAGKNFDFREGGMTYIQYQLGTSQENKLPEHRIKHGFDNIGFNFEEYEYIDESTDPYRVAIRDIPVEYPITYILTGIYEPDGSKWMWRKHFNLYLDLK